MAAIWLENRYVAPRVRRQIGRGIAQHRAAVDGGMFTGRLIGPVVERQVVGGARTKSSRRPGDGDRLGGGGMQSQQRRARRNVGQRANLKQRRE